MKGKHILLCWRSERAGDEVLEHTVSKLEKKLNTNLSEIILLVQKEHKPQQNNEIERRTTPITLTLDDPTNHLEVYEKIVNKVLPRVNDYTNLHVNVSPGTPAMHTVWLILHAGGRFPINTLLWSSQFNPKTGRKSLRKVEFPITTYLSEIRQRSETEPNIATYEVEARSNARIESLEKLKRFALLPKVPLLVLGERGTGKTRTIETIVKSIKQREVVTMACGGLDSSVAESLLFGHKKGAFTGADSDREGLLKIANGNTLFLDEIQDLPQSIQRKLVRVLQDSRHRYRPVGADIEETSEFEIVCASNQSIEKLKESLDPDFYDRISMLKTTIPPLRDCREDIYLDWQNVWNEVASDTIYPSIAPNSELLYSCLLSDNLNGNLRDLQKLAVLVLAYWDRAPEAAIKKAIDIWIVEQNSFKAPSLSEMPKLSSRNEYIKSFTRQLSLEAKENFGTWKKAAAALQCDERTLRTDAKE